MYIKYIMLVFSLFVLLGNSVYAQTKEEVSVQALVAKVKKAAPSHRRELMNELKIKLRSMQQETRTQVMLGLRRAFNTQQSQARKHNIKTNMHHQNTMSMTESKHMQEHMIQDSMSVDNRPQNERPQGQRPTTHNTPMQGK